MARVARTWLRPGKGRAWFPLLLVLASATALAAAAERASTWRDRDIRIDGQDDDWRGLTLPVKGERFALGVLNDGEFLYLCLPTKDPGTRSQIERQGLVVWLDKSGGKRESFGVHFPLGLGLGAKAEPPRPAGPDEGRPQGAPGRQDAVGILGRGGRDAEVVPLEQAGGIEARLGIHDGLLVYELKVPLTRTDAHPYAPDVRPGDLLRLTIETASYRGAAAPLGVPGGGVPGVVVGGGPGGVGVGIGVGGAPGVPAFQNPVRRTLDVRLASGPAR
jgi:hypothetical protein